MAEPDSKERGMRGSSSDMPSYLHIKYGQLSNAPHKKPEGKKIIESRIGNSQESPSYFRTAHGLISKDTYNNPFIQVKAGSPNYGNNTPLKNRQTTNIFLPLKDEQIKDIFNLKEVVTQPIVDTVTNKRKDVGKIQLEINERAVFSDEYQEVSKSSPTPFHRKANYFSDFVERNDVMNVFGGLNTRERQPKFCRVKDYTLDETQKSLLKSVKESSQPSRLWRHNQSILANKDNSFPTIDPNMTAESLQSLKLGQILPSEKQLEQQHQIREKKSVLPLLNSGSFSMNQQDSHFLLGSPHSSMDEQEMQKIKGYKSPVNNRSMILESLEKSITSSYKGSFSKIRSSFVSRNKILADSGHASLVSKIPHRITATKFDLEKEEETQKELESIAEFEKHLKFIQGNDFGGSKMGSVFFRDSKR